jgi:chitin synthase
MPIYNENPESLWRAVNSVQNLEYDISKVTLYLAFDDDTENVLAAYTHLLKCLLQSDIELDITACLLKHGGKKSAQEGAFNLINERKSDGLLFFIDSDIVLKPCSLRKFVANLQNSTSKCMTGMITARIKPTFWTLYQDVEYLTGQIFWRNLEHYFGATSCLPGAFTIMYLDVFKQVSQEYFTVTFKDSFDYQRFYLGEDRYLTHLIMEKFPWSIGFCDTAVCETDAPRGLSDLLKQRRRWFLGHIANDTWMLTSWTFWKMYPILTLVNFLNNARNTSIYIFLVYFALLINTNVSLLAWSLYIVLPIVLNWLFIIVYTSVRRFGKYHNFLFYIVLVVIQPFMSMAFMYHTVFTSKKRTWGNRVQAPC